MKTIVYLHGFVSSPQSKKAVMLGDYLGNVAGGVVSAVTKSGSNSFRGTGTVFVAPSGMVGNNTPSEEFPYHLGYDQQVTPDVRAPPRSWSLVFWDAAAPSRMPWHQSK